MPGILSFIKLSESIQRDMSSITIISYNVNGIRSAIKKGFISWLKNYKPDIVCLQEIKAHSDQIENDLFAQMGYSTYWFPAEKKGYSGTGIITRHLPGHVDYGCGIGAYDQEGRVIRMNFNHFTLVNVYFPSGSAGPTRQSFKMQFLQDFIRLVDVWKRQSPHLLVCGDFNICHKPIDIHDPIGNRHSSGFLPEERAWMDAYFELGMIDTFRMFNPQPHAYSWWTFRTNARARNKGWRIDYITASKSLQANLLSSKMYPEVIHSDHCPVELRLRIKPLTDYKGTANH